jgi:hypothetical protein
MIYSKIFYYVMNTLKLDLLISEINKKLKKKILIKIYVFMLNKYIIF